MLDAYTRSLWCLAIGAQVLLLVANGNVFHLHLRRDQRSGIASGLAPRPPD